MVIAWRYVFVGVIVSALTAGSSCKVLVEDNCANQSVPGNEFCRDLYDSAAPYCSPCRRDLQGCVAAPPFSCEGYYDEISDNDPDDGPSTNDGSSSSGATPDPNTSTTTAGDESEATGGSGTAADDSGSETGAAETTTG